MARAWVVYREGLRLLGAPFRDGLPLERTAARLDVATWRLFTTKPPEIVPLEQARRAPERKRVLLEVGDADRHELCGFVPGFFESPYSLEECERRLAEAAPASPEARP